MKVIVSLLAAFVFFIVGVFVTGLPLGFLEDQQPQLSAWVDRILDGLLAAVIIGLIATSIHERLE